MKFHEYITESLDKKFKWGEHDCVTWAIGWGSTVVGENLLLPFGIWSNKREAIACIKQAGGLSKAFNESTYLKSIHPNFATDGDLVVVGKSACLISGEYAVGTGIKGLMFKDRLLGKEAWTYVN
jgi:hypothetical protein